MSTGTSTIPVPTRSGTPFLIFCLYTFVLIGRPQDYFPSLAPLRLVLVFTVLISIVTMLQKREGISNLFWQRECKLYFLFFGIMCAGIPFSVYRRGSFNFVFPYYLSNIVFYTLFLIHVNTYEKIKGVVAVLMFSGFIFSLFGLLQGSFHEGRYLTGSQMFDPNDAALVAISLFSFGVCVLLGSFRILTKFVALSGLVLSVLLTLYTGSRGGMIGLFTLVPLFLFLPIQRVKKSHKVLVTVLFIAAAVINADKINVERYLTLGKLDRDYNLSDEYGRGQIWKRGMQLFIENPFTGVGVNSFQESIGTMRAQEGQQQVYNAPHNSYIQVLAETGIFGIIVFLLLILNCLKTFNKFRKWREASLERDFCNMSGILLIGFIPLLITAFFLSQAYSILFTLYFAFSAAINGFVPVLGKETTYS